MRLGINCAGTGGDGNQLVSGNPVQTSISNSFLLAAPLISV